MPNMEEVINILLGHKYFTKIDLSRGYWQVALTDESKPLTPFETGIVPVQNYVVWPCKCWRFILQADLHHSAESSEC